MLSKKYIKNAMLLFLLASVLVGFKWLCKPEEPVFPEAFVITFDQLDEIQELANDRTRDYGEILDDISDKIDELKRDSEFRWKEEYNYKQEQEIDNRNEAFY